MIQLARSLDDVLIHLDQIIGNARERRSRMGYFPALYRHVTREVRRRSQESYFDDPDRMRTLTVNFANRYIHAYETYRSGEDVPRAWTVAFDSSENWWPIVLQHLLLGMNAHINFDLGLAATQTVPPDRLGDLRADFRRINHILGDMIDDIQDRLARVWPAMKLLDWMGQRIDETIMNFNLTRARDHAWSVARELSRLEVDQRKNRIQRLDQNVADLGRLILHPGLLLSSANKVVRLGERKNVAEVIDLLGD